MTLATMLLIILFVIALIAVALLIGVALARFLSVKYGDDSGDSL